MMRERLTPSGLLWQRPDSCSSHFGTATSPIVTLKCSFGMSQPGSVAFLPLKWTLLSDVGMFLQGFGTFLQRFETHPPPEGLLSLAASDHYKMLSECSGCASGTSGGHREHHQVVFERYRGPPKGPSSEPTDSSTTLEGPCGGAESHRWRIAWPLPLLPGSPCIPCRFGYGLYSLVDTSDFEPWWCTKKKTPQRLARMSPCGV